MSLISAFIAKAVSVEHSTVAWFTKEWQIIVKNEPKIEAITDTAVTYIGGCVQLALAGTGNTLLSAQVGNVVNAIHSKLLSTSALITDFGATKTAADAFSTIQQHLQELDSLLGVKSATATTAVQKAITEAGNMASAVSAAATAIEASVANAPAPLPVLGVISTLPTAAPAPSPAAPAEAPAASA